MPWRWPRARAPGWAWAAALIALVTLLPIATILRLALDPAQNIWPHLVSTVLPRSIATTLTLMAGTGLFTLLLGTGTAWLVTMYRFPGRGTLDRLLVIPLAMPTYIVAYCYAELLDYAGPLQSAMRASFGWHSPRDYWFPDIRSTGGAILVFSVVLYPYVYLSARASFVQQSVCALEVARTLGRTAMGAFLSVALPLARPALAAGVAMVMMECLNDLGAVQYLGVDSLTATIYATWLQRASLSGAAQIASVALAFVLVVLWLERHWRGRGSVHHTTGRYRSIPFQDLVGWRGYAALAIGAIPFVLGFLVPFGLLVRHALTHSSAAVAGGYVRAAANSLALATLTAAGIVVVALLIAYARRIAGSRLMSLAARAAGLGYAIPGTVLAIGLIIPLAALDNAVDAWMRQRFGIATGLVLSGSLFALWLACIIRFLAIGLSNLEAGMDRISPNLDAAARALGETALSTLRRVHLPLLLPALGAAGLLVFVDTMKELPATLMLRPFNFETLSTFVYASASLEKFEEAALGALTIVLVGLVPTLLLHRTVAGGRAGQRRARA
jgi:iron(III) transport system permease protein